jgi:hypothetical protein
MKTRHSAFLADDGMAFMFFDREICIHSKMGIKEATAFAADILQTISMMQKEQEEKYESISNQSTDIES